MILQCNTWINDRSWTDGSPVKQSFANINIFSSLVWMRFFFFLLSPRMWKRSRPSLSALISFKSFFSLRLSCIPSFSLFGVDNSVLFRYCLVQRPFCIFLLFSSDLCSGIFFLFLFAFFQSLIGNFLFFPFFFQMQGWAFSPRGQGLWGVGILAQGL